MTGWRHTVRVREVRSHTPGDTKDEAEADDSEEISAHVAKNQPESDVHRDDVGLAQSALSFRC
jgi:hypothetical protein